LAVAPLACALAGGVPEVVMSAQPAAQPALRCEIAVERAVLGGPVELRFALHNATAEPVHVLGWNTPFEGAWFGTSFTVKRDGEDLPYSGPQAKRGDPERDDYVPIAPGEAAAATADLALVYAFDRPGSYEVRVDGQLHDVVRGTTPALPRTRDDHAAVALDCAPLRLTLPAG
jgi:hypothetical protein